jgi:Ca-activated chloride channel homolog
MSFLGGLQFGAPWVLGLLVFLPLWWLWRMRRRPAAIVFSRVGTLVRGPRAGRFVARALFVLRNVVLATVIVALARPRTGASSQQVTSQGIDIMIAFDISSSMLAEDFQPRNRLEVARDLVRKFVLSRTSDRLGLVAFSGEALTQVPLTTDYPVVEAAVRGLQPGQLEDGTAIGTAIATAANRLRRSPGKSRVIVLLTDGENNRGSIDPRTAGKAAKSFGIKIYAIGVGTVGMARVPVGRGVGGLRFEYQPVRIDDALLTEVATSTGGRYFRATDAAALERILEQIDQLERTPVQTRTYTRFTERYVWPLALALTALALELAFVAWKAPLP